jgi:transmembrane sensor
MSNLLRLPNRRQTAEQAAEWAVALKEGLSEEQRQRLHQWLRADPTHAGALERMARHWDAFDALAELSETFPLAPPARHPVERLTFKAAAVVAVAFVGVVTLAAAVYLLKGRDLHSLLTPSVTAGGVATSHEEPRQLAGASDSATRNYRTTVGRQLTASLPDGSVVTLNTDTSLEVQFSASRRLVILKKGEAIFRVAHNPLRPFQVQVGSRIVQALGTVFNVMFGGAEDDLRVTVSEGSVKVLDPEPPRPQHGPQVAPAHPELLVRAGEQAIFGAAGEQIRHMEVSQIEAKDAWQRGLLIYQGDTLDAVIADMSRYTTVRFSISDQSIRSRRVGGVFRAGDVDGLLLALRESFGINARREGNVIVLTASR